MDSGLIYIKDKHAGLNYSHFRHRNNQRGVGSVDPKRRLMSMKSKISRYFRRLTKTHFIIFFLTACSVFAAAMAVRKGNAIIGQQAATGQDSVAARAKPTPTRLDSVLITINRRGFEPAALSRPKGKFFLLVENRSGLREVDLRLDRVAGNRLHEVKVPREQLDWAELLDLNPGEYRLTEAGRSDWACRITITPQ
jgi:hypothetical protein